MRKAGDAATLPRTEQDIPIAIMVGIVSLVCLIPLGFLINSFLSRQQRPGRASPVAC